VVRTHHHHREPAADSVPLTGIIVTDALPAGMVVASPADASTTCGAGTVTAVPGSATIALRDGSLARRRRVAA